MSDTSEQRYRSRVPVDLSEALTHIREFGFPVELYPAFVPGGWPKTANTEDELLRLMEEGQSVSPVGEVQFRWPVR